MAGDALDAALSRLQASLGADARLLVGLSGGLDSTVLLHALAARLGTHGLRAVHVHHGLQLDAEAWSAHCKAFCQQLGIALVTRRVQVAAASGLGPEGAAREARYAAFRSTLEEGEALVLAHHRDDQAETVLLRLLRAAGSSGLGAMRAQRGFAGTRLLRPLLEVPRSALHAYAMSHRLAWCEDPSNASGDADRNFLRLQVLPRLRQRWPQAGAALAGSAARLAEDARLLDEVTDLRLDRLSQGQSWLPVTALLALDAGWRAKVLRRWLERAGLPPLPGAALGIVARDVLAAGHDREAIYRHGAVELRRWRDRVYAIRRQPPTAVDWRLPWDGRVPLGLPAGGALQLHGAAPASLAETFGDCSVGPRRGGERLRLPGRAHSHALKQVLQAIEMPPWERRQLPLLHAGDGELLAAGDALLSARFAEWLQAQGLRLEWVRAD